MREKKSERWTKPLHNHETVTYTKVGTDKLQCSRVHGAVIFVLGTAHRDEAFRRLRALRKEAKAAAGARTRRDHSKWAEEEF